MTGSFSNCSLVVVAGGSGERFGGAKQFADLGGWPLLAYCLGAFDSVPDFAARVVVLPRGGTEHPSWGRIVATLEHPVEVVEGGATRALSVRAGVVAAGERSEFVAVHDGARPFPPLEAMRRAVGMLADDADLAAAIVARRATDTLKRVDGAGGIAETLDRAAMACAETPQVCRALDLLRALELPEADTATDEAHALERAGHRTAVVLHDGHNPKVTHPGDLALAAAWLATDEGAAFRLANITP